MAYGLGHMTVYKWMRKLSFEHLNGMVIYVKTTNEFFFGREDLRQSNADLRFP